MGLLNNFSLYCWYEAFVCDKIKDSKANQNTQHRLILRYTSGLLLTRQVHAYVPYTPDCSECKARASGCFKVSPPNVIVTPSRKILRLTDMACDKTVGTRQHEDI